MNEEKTYLTDEQLDVLADTLEEERIISTKDSAKDTETNENAELEAEQVTISNDSDASDIMIKTVDTMPAKEGVSLFDLDGDDIIEYAKNADYDITQVDEKTKDMLSKELDLSDDDVFRLVETLSRMKSEKGFNVYAALPEKIRAMVRAMASNMGLSPKEYNNISKAVMNELVADANIDSAFVDLENALNEALNIPSIIDLYSDHMKTVMEVNLPQMIENIKDEEPEKAELLTMVSEAFKKGYTFETAKDMYDNTTSLRKAIRRSDKMLKRCLNEFNFKNEKSNFKFNDATEIPGVLHHILIEEPMALLEEHKDDKDNLPEHVKKILDMQITSLDIDKFAILVTKSCEDLNPRDIVDASYMYYLVKNIVVLKHTQEAKTEFAVELISNICDTIAYLRNKEAEFYAARDIQ